MQSPGTPIPLTAPPSPSVHRISVLLPQVGNTITKKAGAAGRALWGRRSTAAPGGSCAQGEQQASLAHPACAKQASELHPGNSRVNNSPCSPHRTSGSTILQLSGVLELHEERGLLLLLRPTLRPGRCFPHPQPRGMRSHHCSSSLFHTSHSSAAAQHKQGRSLVLGSANTGICKDVFKACVNESMCALGQCVLARGRMGSAQTTANAGNAPTPCSAPRWSEVKMDQFNNTDIITSPFFGTDTGHEHQLGH